MKWIPWFGLALTFALAACDDGGSTPSTSDGGVPLDGDLADSMRLDGRPNPDGGAPDDGVADMMPTVDGGEDGDALLPDGDVPDGDVPDGELPPDMMPRCGELNPCPPLPDGRPQRCDENTGMCVEDEPPAAEAIEVRVPEDGQVVVTLRGSDAADQPLTYEVVEQPARGRLEGEPPELTYIPEPDAFGADRFTYVAIDAPAGQRSVPAEVSVTIDPVNDAPVIENQAPIRTPEDTPREVALADLVVRDDGPLEALVVEVLPGERYAADGATYTPAADYFGPLQVTVRVVDGEGEPSAPYALDTQVDAVNDPPRIVGTEALTTPEDTPITPTLDALQVVDDGPAEALSLRLLPGENYALDAGAVAPAPDFAGELTVGVVVVDGEGAESEPATLTITVTPVNDPPRVVGTQPLTTAEDTPLTPTLDAVQVEDDGAADGLSLRVLPGENYTVEDGAIVPAPDFAGELTVNVVVVDGDGAESEPTTISVTVTPVNDPPRLTGLDPSPVTVPEDQPLALEARFFVVEDEDPAGLRFEAQPGENYTIDDQGRVIPAPDFTGEIRVNVVAVDADGLRSDPLVLPVQVLPVGDPPVIQGQVSLAATEEDTPYTIQVGELDVSDVDSDPAVLSVRVLPGDNYTADGAQVTPAQDFNGALTVRLVVSDGTGDSEPFDFLLDVLPVNDPPAIAGAGQPVDAREDTPVRVGTLALQIVDPDSDVFEVEVLPGDGYQVDAEGLAVPDRDLNGPLTVNVRALDDQGAASAPFALVVQLAPINDPPVAPGVAFDDLVAHAPFVAPAGALLEGATDVEGDALTVVPRDVGTAAGGQVVIAADGGFSYTGPVGGLGDDSFRYLVQDAEGATTEATARLVLAHRVWFVQSLAFGRGRLDDPLGSLDGAFALAEAGDYVFIRPGLSELNALQALTIPAGVQVVGEGAGLTLGRNLAIPAGEYPGVIGAPDLFVLSDDVGVRGLQVSAQRALFVGDGVGDVVLSDLVVGLGEAEVLRVQDLAGPLVVAGVRTAPMVRAGGGLVVRGGAAEAVVNLRDVDLHVFGNGLLMSGLPAVNGEGVTLDSSGGAAIELTDIGGLDLQATELTSVGSFGPGISLFEVTGSLAVGRANLNEASEGGLLVQGGAPVVQIDELNSTGGFNAVRFNSPEGRLTVGEPGDDAALNASFSGESVIWARAGDVTVYGLRAAQVLGHGIQVPPGADLAQLTVSGAQFVEVEGHALLVGEDGEAFDPTIVRAATLSDWVVSAPMRAPIHLNGIDQSAIAVDGLRAEDFAAGVDGVMGWGAGTVTLNNLVLRGQSGAADGVRLVGDGALTVRVTGGEFTSAGGDNAVRLVGDGRPATVDFAVVGARIGGWLGDRISLDAGDGDATAVLRADDNRINPSAQPGFGAGIRLMLEGDVAGAQLQGTLSAQNNEIDQPGSHGIDVTLRDAASNTADVLLVGNRVAGALGDAIRLRALDGAQVRAAIRNNEAGNGQGAGLRIVSDDPAQVAVEGAGEDPQAALEAQNPLDPVVVPAGVRVIPVGSVEP